LLAALLASTACGGADDGDGVGGAPAHLANSSATLGGGLVRFRSWAQPATGVGRDGSESVWTVDLHVFIDAEAPGVDHRLVFFAHNAGVGEFVAGAQSVDGSRAWNGLYDGELGTTRLVGRDSRFAITALDEETVSGTFLAVLENGPAFLDGVFTDLQIYDR